MEWDVYSDAHEPLSDDLIAGIEKVIGFTLPKDYVECVKFYHGGQPKGRDLKRFHTASVDCCPLPEAAISHLRTYHCFPSP
ncbi:hypothetical protein PS903_01375 [Pseudomonas fluorescens]|nr:hypothetical protein PS903_01375 [Pseudomonas fluorescens]